MNSQSTTINNTPILLIIIRPSYIHFLEEQHREKRTEELELDRPALN